MYRNNYIPSFVRETYKNTKRKLKMKKDALEPVDFEEEKRKDPKYKTELCKSFMQTNFCVYGNKCRFAHGYKELVNKTQINNYKHKTCNSFFNIGYCPYGKRCNFKHDERKINDFENNYYFNNLIFFHFLNLKSCKRLNVFEEISEIFKKNNTEIENETENCKNSDEINGDENNESFSDENSFISEKSSQASSDADTPIKNKKEFCFQNLEECLPQELNFELDFNDENSEKN